MGPKATQSLGPQLFTEGPSLHHLDGVAARQAGASNDASTDAEGDALQGSHSSSALHDLMEQGMRSSICIHSC